MFDAVGNLYLLADPYTARPELRKYSSDGVLLVTYSMNAASRATDIDLAADQCTMFILRHGDVDRYRAEVARYDVCRAVDLPTVTIGDGVITDPYYSDFDFSPRQFRILPGGSLLIPAGDHVVLLDAAGRLLRTYRTGRSDGWGEFVGVALDPDGRGFWAVTQYGSDDGLYRIDLKTGLVLSGPFRTYSGGGFNSLAVSSEPRAAITAPPVSVPTLSDFVLLALATILIAVAVRRIL